MGPQTVVIKKGEHGALMFQGGEVFFAPAYPLDKVVDPTGAGDTFAGGFVGYLASRHQESGTVDLGGHEASGGGRQRHGQLHV